MDSVPAPSDTLSAGLNPSEPANSDGEASEASRPTAPATLSPEAIEKRFKAIDTNIALINNVFNLKGATKRKEANHPTFESDISSDSDIMYDSDDDYDEKLIRGVMNETVRVLGRLSNSHRAYQRTMKERRLDRVRTRRMEGRKVLERGNEEASRLIGTKMYLENKPAVMGWIDWSRMTKFWERPLEDSVSSPLHAVTGDLDRQVISKLYTHPWATQVDNTLSEEPKYQPRDIVAKNPAQEPSPERLRIHSAALNAVFRKIADIRIPVSITDGSSVIARPFRMLVYNEKKLRDHLNGLEKHFDDLNRSGGLSDTSQHKPLLTSDGTNVPQQYGSTEEHTQEQIQGVIDIGESQESVKGRNPMAHHEATNTAEAAGDPAVGDPTEEAPAETDTAETDPTEGTQAENGPAERDPAEQDSKSDDSEDEDSADSITALLHLRCLMKFFDDEIKPKLEHIASDQCSKILFNDLWYLYKPGDEVLDQAGKQALRVIQVQSPHHSGRDIESRFKSRFTDDSDDDTEEAEDRMTFKVRCAYIDYNGKKFGPVSVTHTIPPYGGVKDVDSLPLYPLRLAKDLGLRERLITRGKMLLDITKLQPMYYTGDSLHTGEDIDSQVIVDFGEALADETRQEWSPALGLTATQETNTTFRCDSICCTYLGITDDQITDQTLAKEFIDAMVPKTQFHAPSLILEPRPLGDMISSTGDKLKDEEFLVMTHRGFGFVLRTRKWCMSMAWSFPLKSATF